MSKKPMLSVERELLERLRVPAEDAWIEWIGDAGKDLADALDELRSLLDKPAGLDRAVSLTINREMRVYIAGPMTGLPEFNFPAFNAMAEKMRGAGWHVENPAEHGHVDGAEWADYLRYDIGRLATCEAVMLLPGWSKSRGARLEVSIAKELGMPFMFAEGAEHEPAAKHQGEPVAYTTTGMLEIAKRLPLTGRIGAKATKDERWNIPLFLRQVEQPAPVSVVMPERYSLAMYQMISGFESVTPEQFDLVWSACRADVARLNGVKP